MGETSRQLPQYQCHKIVGALKIKDIQLNNTIVPEEEEFAPFEIEESYFEKHKPVVGGYYVVYADGYKSFSPAEAFESGYSKI